MKIAMVLLLVAMLILPALIVIRIMLRGHRRPNDHGGPPEPK